MAVFADRADAGRRLAGRLGRWREADAVVVGIARGGVAVSAAAAAELGLPATAIAVRKLGVPGHEEGAFGAIADGVRLIDERTRRAAGVTDAQSAGVEERERDLLARRRALIPDAGRALGGKSVLLVDDGVATGATANAAGRALRAASPARIVLAVPVAPAAWRPDHDAADDYVCVHPDADFWAVGAYYDDFGQITDAEVARLLGGG